MYKTRSLLLPLLLIGLFLFGSPANIESGKPHQHLTASVSSANQLEWCCVVGLSCCLGPPADALK